MYWEETQMFKLTAALAAASMALVSTSAIAQGSASKLSLSNARTTTVAKKSNGIAGAGAYVLGAVALGLVVWGVIEITDDNSDSN